MAEKSRHARKSQSRARTTAHKYDGHKLANVVNHVHFERHHGFESDKHPALKLTVQSEGTMAG